MAISCVIYFNAAGAALLKRVWRPRPQRISCFELVCLVTHFLLISLSSLFFSRFYLFFFLSFFLPSFHTSSCLSTICLFYFFLTTPFLPSSPPSCRPSLLFHSFSLFSCLFHLFLSSSIFHFKSPALLFFLLPYIISLSHSETIPLLLPTFLSCGSVLMSALPQTVNSQ